VTQLKGTDRELWLSVSSAQERADWVTAFRTVMTARAEAAAAAVAPRDAPNEQWEIDASILTVNKLVGSGSFGDVFKGRLWGTDVAVKKLKKVTPRDLEDLQREISILSTLRHPNMILYIGACTKREQDVCIVTEWAEHGSLFDVLHNADTHLSVQTIIQYATSIAQGMNYLHSLEHRIIHRDLKSHNILMDKNYQIKIADFGISHVRAAGPRSGSSGSDRDRVKGAGHYGVYGTPEWMAPEIMEDSEYDHKVDVYSFGIVLTELLSRRLPFHERNFHDYMDIVDAVLDEGAKPLIPEWSEPLFRSLLDLCLDRDPQQRPSFTDVILKLRELMDLDEGHVVRLLS
jgi:serine/threonine protein kinase